MFNTANILTLSRLALLPLIVLLLFMPWAWAAWAALILYIIGAVTDYFDGWVARRYNQITEFGTFLDPIADKIYVAALLLMLVATDRIDGIWVILVVIILIREFMVSGLREYLGPKGIKVPVSKLAKWKTAVQMIATGFLIIGPFVSGGLVTGAILLLAATALTCVTGWDYLKTGLAHMKEIA
jgi:cardiolipin synthase (CMP-forming)